MTDTPAKLADLNDRVMVLEVEFGNLQAKVDQLTELVQRLVALMEKGR
jgi:hypothetical protein